MARLELRPRRSAYVPRLATLASRESPRGSSAGSYYGSRLPAGLWRPRSWLGPAILAAIAAAVGFLLGRAV